MLARYAAADLADLDDRRGRAMGRLVAAASVGAVAGPNLLGPTAAVAQRLTPVCGAVAGGGGVMLVQAPVEISYFHTAPVAWPATRSHRNHRC